MKFILALMMIMLTSCGFKSIENGNVGIVIDSFSKNVHDNVLTSGLHFKPFTSVVEIDSTDIRIEMVNLQPKDQKGMKFEDVDLTVTVRLGEQKKTVIAYKETKEINSVEHNDGNVLGYQKMQQIIKSVTTKAFTSMEYQEFMDDREKLEGKIKELLEVEIEKQMYGAYQVKSVRSTTINLMPEIEKSFQNRSLVAQKRLLIKSEEQLMLERLEVEKKEMDKLRDIAKNAGITVKDLMKYKIDKERNDVLSDISKGSGTNILLNVDQK